MPKKDKPAISGAGLSKESRSTEKGLYAIKQSIRYESRRQAFIREIYESGARLIPLAGGTKIPPRGWDWNRPVPSVEFLARHPGGIGIFPAESGLLCIDVDKGHPDVICELLDDFQIPHIRHKTGRPGGYHIWIRYSGGKVTRQWSRNGAGGDLIYSGRYAKGWHLPAIVEILDTDENENVAEFLIEIGALRGKKQKIRPPGPAGVLGASSWADSGPGKILKSKSKKQKAKAKSGRPRSGRTDKKANRLFISGYVSFDESSGDTAESDIPIVKGNFVYDYRNGNRSNALNADIWYSVIMGRDIEPAIAAARAAGFTDKDLDSRVRYTVKAACEHWFYKLRTGDFNPRGLTPAQARVLTALAAFADWGDIEGNQGGGNARPSRATIAAKAGCGIATVARALPALIQGGWITRTGTWKVKAGPGIGIYQINVGKIRGLSGTAAAAATDKTARRQHQERRRQAAIQAVTDKPRRQERRRRAAKPATSGTARRRAAKPATSAASGTARRRQERQRAAIQAYRNRLAARRRPVIKPASDGRRGGKALTSVFSRRLGGWNEFGGGWDTFARNIRAAKRRRRRRRA